MQLHFTSYLIGHERDILSRSQLVKYPLFKKSSVLYPCHHSMRVQAIYLLAVVAVGVFAVPAPKENGIYYRRGICIGKPIAVCPAPTVACGYVCNLHLL